MHHEPETCGSTSNDSKPFSAEVARLDQAADHLHPVQILRLAGVLMTSSAARRPQALDPAIVKLVEELARAQARREDRANRKLAGQEPQQQAVEDGQ